MDNLFLNIRGLSDEKTVNKTELAWNGNSYCFFTDVNRLIVNFPHFFSLRARSNFFSKGRYALVCSGLWIFCEFLTMHRKLVHCTGNGIIKPMCNSFVCKYFVVFCSVLYLFSSRFVSFVSLDAFPSIACQIWKTKQNETSHRASKSKRAREQETDFICTSSQLNFICSLNQMQFIR